MFFLYQIILTIIILISPLIIIIRLFKNKEDKKRFLEKFCFFSKKRGTGKIIWFHGSSVGEILSIIPLIQNLEKNKSINKILITSSTLSSSKIIKSFKFKKVIHQFYPIDHIIFVNRFLNYWKPSVAIFLESEIWPGMFKEIEKKKISLILLNARITKKTFDRWSKINSFSQSIFNKVSMAYPQNFETIFFLKKLKVKNINFIGNLKYIENEEKKDTLNIKLKKQFTKKKIWVASSTHHEEEIFCAKTHIQLKKENKNLVTIIIPRHIHRVNEIINKIKQMNLKVSIHSLKPRNLNNTDIYIVDTFGETKKFFKIAPSVFLGGSIATKGGQNPLEAVRYGSKIFHGPNIDNFKDVYKLLNTLKASQKIKTPKELASLITFKKNIKTGKKIEKIGAIILKKTIKQLNTLINNEFKKT